MATRRLRVCRVSNGDASFRCAACGRTPKSWWSLRCSSCDTNILTCASCYDRQRAAANLDAHRRDCDGTPGDLPPMSRTRSQIFRPAVRAGGQLGFASKGPTGAVVGTVAGAVLGALADHVLQRPEIQPTARFVRSLYDVLSGARQQLLKRKKDVDD